MSCVRRRGTTRSGHRVLYLGKLFEQSFHLSSVVEPALHALAAQTKESASYYVHDNGRRLCLFRAEPSEGLRETRVAGTTFPLDDTAISQVIRFWGLGEPIYDEPPALPLFTAGARDVHTAGVRDPDLRRRRQVHGGPYAFRTGIAAHSGA
ncbi:hypothetical protein FEP09_05804 [Burkholderia multivorans]|nr:hypothetical protein [Burkholderia multivorans]